MISSGRMKRGRRAQPSRKKKPPSEAGRKSVMVVVYMTPAERMLLDEICFYIGKNSHGNFRPSRTEIIRRLVGRLRGAKKSLKQARTSEDLDKVIKRI